MKHFVALALALVASGQSLFGSSIFSVQSGDLTINSQNTTTAGSKVAPWTLNETLRAAGIVSLENDEDIPLGSLPPFVTGAWIQKTVLNDTGTVWTSFELELQEILGIASSDGDGLSFAQAGSLTFSSDRFNMITRLDNTRDYLNFSGGSVLDGESVTFLFAVTDNSPQSPVFLAQTPNRTDGVSAAPEPAGVVMLLGLALTVGVIRQRKSIQQR